MRPRIDPDRRLLTLAGFQGGVLSTEQIAAHGLGRHSLERLRTAGQWTLLSPGIYVTTAETPRWEALAWAGVLLGGEGSRLGGRAAGHLAGLVAAPTSIDVLIPHDRLRTNREPWRFLRERAAVRSSRSVGSPPRLPIEDTVVDLSDDATEAQLIDLVTTAVQRRLTTADRLRRVVERRSRVRHRAVLLRLLADVADGAQSPLELDFARDVERPHGLPKARRQAAARRGKDFRDVTYEEFGVVVELDGRVGHDGVGVFRDMARDNAAVVQGEVTLRYGWYDVRVRACPVAFQIGHVIGMRGWSGVVTRCPRCRYVPEAELGDWIR